MSSFSGGFFKGVLLSAVGVGAVSLYAPLNTADPSTKTQVELTTPSGSGFNQGRNDSDPVLPRTDQTVTTDTTGPVGNEPSAPDDSQSSPQADTTSASQPSLSAGIEMPQVDAGDGNSAILTPSSDPAPIIPPAAIGVPMPQIDNPVTEIPVNRLPVIEQPITEIIEPSPGVGTSPDTATQPATQTRLDGALAINKVAFENPAGKPLFSIILIDAGSDGLDREALTTFTFPVTFAIDPTDPDAGKIADSYRAGGFEVVALAPSGEAALVVAENDADIQIAVQSLMSSLPNSVGMVDGISATLQKSPKLADQVIAALNESGHGLVTYDIGLNATNQKAISAGLDAGTVFRVIDAEHETATVIKRYLDRAALEAGKDGHVIMLGHTYPETVTALFSWAISPKSGSVALAPLSASLLAQ